MAATKNIKRRDSKKRILRIGETQGPDGRYQLSWTESGVRKHFYSWKLEKTDKVPSGKKNGLSIREKAAQIQLMLLQGIRSTDMTVMEAVELHIARKAVTVKPNTRYCHENSRKILEQEPQFSNRKVSSIKTSEAKDFLIYLQLEKKYSFSTINQVKSMLKLSFEDCMMDDLIARNPFIFPLSSVVYKDVKSKDALSKYDEKRLLKFLLSEQCYRPYYEAVYILLHTGLRISEFCALTDEDVDFKKKRLHINKQLMYRKKEGGVFIQTTTKTSSGQRIIPISEEVVQCFFALKKRRTKEESEITVSGYKGFFYFTRNRLPMTGSNWSHIFRNFTESFNNTYKTPLQVKLTPHICRHTFASRCATSNKNPICTAAILGHSNAETTLSVYTHISTDDIEKEFREYLDTGSFDLEETIPSSTFYM